MVPQRERSSKNFLDVPSSLISGFSFHKIERANSIATKLRKKLFWMEGRSPLIRTNIFISAKEKEESRMQQTPLFFCVMTEPPFWLLPLLWRRGSRSNPDGRDCILRKVRRNGGIHFSF